MVNGYAKEQGYGKKADANDNNNLFIANNNAVENDEPIYGIRHTGYRHTRFK